MEFNLGEVEAKMHGGAGYENALNYLIQSQQCGLAAHLTELMNKYPKGSPERVLLKSIVFGVAYGNSDSTINIHTDLSPEEMMSRLRDILERVGENQL